jgi:L-ascorbate metabolism protein UlaG (beta-lactamase superfamily)
MISPFKVFGKNPSGERRNQVLRSPNFLNGAFRNPVKTAMMREGVSVADFVKDFFNKTTDRVPDAPLPSVLTAVESHTDDAPAITWFGHSSYHISLGGKFILVDPVFSGYASPFSFGVKAFPGTDVYGPENFSRVDLLLLTHDHYDHLDYKTLVKLKGKVRKVVCSLGVGQHLVHWGFEKSRIQELDWWDATVYENIKVTATPARHFSGRILKRAQTLWSAFVIEADGYRIFAGGDSGYAEHFRRIGERFDGFDAALLECGQYNYKWPYIHMLPEETVQAGIDLGARLVIPVHWGKFALAFHPWYEPAERFITEAVAKNVPHALPMIGERLVIGERKYNGSGLSLVRRWWNKQ